MSARCRDPSGSGGDPSLESRNYNVRAVVGALILLVCLLLTALGWCASARSAPLISSWSPRWLTLLNPLRHYLEIVRAVFLKGAGLDVLWPQHLALAALGAAILAAAVGRFGKRLG